MLKILHTPKISVFLATAILALSFLGTLKAGSFEITSVVSQTVGSTAIITGSGDKNNTGVWAAGVVGVFTLNGGTHYLRVSATNPTGFLVAGTDSLMVARTVNSQGLTDQGTLSVYVSPGPPTGTWTLDLTFDFYTDLLLTTPAVVALELTSLDIDFGQRYYTENSDFTSVLLYPGTAITAAPGISGYSGYTAAGGSAFDDPRYAVSSFGTKSSFDVKVAHNAVGLFIFEFRDPSAIVPEPTSLGLLLTGLICVAGLSRRNRRVK